jgi:calcium-dependent protein kinase
MKDNNSFIRKESKIMKGKFVGSFCEDIEETYKFLKELGAGAFGKVYLVEHLKSKQTYACKRLSKKKIKNIESIISEINMLKNLDHPNIVKLFEIYEDKSYLFLVMEELKGGELFDRILDRAQNKNYYTEKEVSRLFKQIVSGINYCHKEKICHRDIKPENIVFSDASEQSDVKLIDFGLSKTFNSSKKNEMKTRVGTCFYMSPEVIKGEYNEKCDVWSLGVLLYVLISGRAPFNGSDDNAIIKKVTEGKFEFKWEGWKGISDDCKNLIRHMLTVDVKKRPTAEEVLQNPWISLGAPKASDIPIIIELDEIKKYAQLDKLSKAVSGFIAFRLAEQDVKTLTQTFQSIDKNGDGSLSLDELKSGLSLLKTNNSLDMNVDDLEKIFSSIDLDNNGVINYNEFITATFDKNKILNKEFIYEAFRMFDVDKSGKISINELEHIITPETKDDIEEIKEIFKKLDDNGDGEIDFEEFLKNFIK